MRNQVDELLHDEVEEQFEQLRQKKRKRKRKMKRIRLFLLLFLVVGGTLYFTSDVSKVKSLRVVGNKYYSDEAILSFANLDYQSRFLLQPALLIAHRIERNDLIDDVHVKKNMSGGITIEVKEKQVIGYLGKKKNRLQVLDEKGEIIALEESFELEDSLAYIQGFEEGQLSELAKAFSKLDDWEYVSMISEILPHEETYEKDMVKLIMQDGNSIFVSYKGIALLSHYKDVLKPLKGNHVCLWIDETTKAISKKDCPSVAEAVESETQ